MDLRVRAALVSIAVCVAVYPDVVFSGRTFVPAGRVPEAYVERPDQRSPLLRVEYDAGAFAWEVMPWAHVEHRALAGGELPLWDRFSGLGHPLLGSGQTALFYPLHWLPVLDPSKPALWDLAFLLLRFFAAFGSVLLLLELGAPFWLAALGAPIGALNGTFTVLLTRADLQAYACMPWILLALVRLRRAPGPRPALGLAIALALCLFGAHPEPSFAVIATCALAAAALVFREEPGRVRFFGWAALGAGCAALLSAPFWLPLLDLIPKSWSLHPLGSYGPDRRPIARLAEWLMPTVFEHGKLWTLFGGGAVTSTAYLGPTCGVLAIAAVIGALRARALAWVWPAMFLVLVIHGAPGTAWLWRIPVLSRMPVDFYFPFPVLYLLAISGVVALDRRTVIAAALVLLVALATAPIWAGPIDKPLIKLGWAALAATAFAALALRPRLRPLLFLACAADLAAFRSPLSRRADPLEPGPFVRWLQQRGGQFRVIGLGLTLSPDSAAAFGLEDVRLCEALFPPRVVSGMSALVQFKPDTTWHTTADPADGFDAFSPMLDWMNVRYLVTQNVPPLSIRSQPMRAFLDVGPPIALPRMDANALPALAAWAHKSIGARMRVPPQRPILAGRIAHLRPNEIPAWEIAAEGTAAANGGEGAVRADLSRWAGREVPVELRATEYALWIDLHWESPSGDRDPPENLLGALRIAYRDSFIPDLLVLERPHPWPRVTAAAAPEISADPLARMKQPRSEPFAIVEDDFPKAAWDRICAGCTGPLRATLSQPVYTQNRVTFDADVDRPAIAVLADAWTEGWRATVDGEPAPLFHANWSFRGVIVPAGKHRIEMRYAPRAWTIAFWLAFAGLLLAAYVASSGWRRKVPSES